MKKLLLPLLLCAAAPLAPALSRPQATATETLPDARVVIARYLEVTKLGASLEKTQSRYEKASFAVPGIEGTVESWSAKPTRQRTAFDLGGFGQQSAGTNGEVAWMTSPMTGPTLLDGMDLLQTRLESDYMAPLKPAALYESVRTVGRETFEGKECWKVELVAKPLAGMDAAKTLVPRTSHEYYEVESGLLIGSKGTMDGKLVTGPSSFLYSDYKDFGGVLLPARKRMHQGGVEVEITTLVIQYDTVTDADLAPPSDVQTMIDAAKAAPAGGPKPQ